MEKLLEDIEIPSVEDGLYEELTLKKGYVWNIFPQSTKYELMAFQAENLGNIMPQRGKALCFNFINAEEDITIRLQSNAPKGTTAKSYYSKRFFFDLGMAINGSGGGGGGGEILTFETPLHKDGTNVVLKLADDLSVDAEDKLTLVLENNQSFKDTQIKTDENSKAIVVLDGKVDTLLGLTLRFIGVIDKSSQEVTQNPQLLTDFVIQEIGTSPTNGCLVRTNDAYAFIYSQQGDRWINFGTSEISLATTESAGLIKLGTQSGELEDVGNGKVKVIGFDDKASKTYVEELLNSKLLIFGKNIDPATVLTKKGTIGYLELV